MWDLKPDAPDSIRGPFQPIDTNVPGMQIGDLLPMTAQQADKFSIIRSMSHTSTSHDVGIKYTLLADSTTPGPAYPPKRTDHPGMGAIVRNLVGAPDDFRRGSPCRVHSPRARVFTEDRPADFWEPRTTRFC